MSAIYSRKRSIAMKYGNTDPRGLRRNPWNSNHVSPEIQERLDNSVRKHGLFKPILVREIPEGLEILGGSHRVDSAIRLNMVEVPIINLGVITDQRAKEISLIDNARYGHDDLAELHDILKDIGTPEDIMAILPMELSEMPNLTSLTVADLDDIGFADDKDDDVIAPPVKITKTHATMRFKIPLGDEPVVSQTIESLIREHGLDDSDSQVNAGDALLLLIRQLQESAK